MIYVNSKLRYMFEKAPANYVTDEITGKSCRIDKMVFVTFKSEELDKLGIVGDAEWDVLHIDGSYDNDSLDNLELVIFKNDKFFKDNKMLEQQMLSAIKRAEAQEKVAAAIASEKTIDNIKINSLNKQINYEQGRVKELNKELRKQEKEIRRLMSIIENINKHK